MNLLKDVFHTLAIGYGVANALSVEKSTSEVKTTVATAEGRVLEK